MSRAESDTPVTPARFRAALGRFATGVTVVCARGDGGEIHGMTANAFMSVSLSPPLVAVAVRDAAHLAQIVRAGTSFGVTVLAEDQEHEAARFAGLPVRASAGPVVFGDLAGEPVIAGGIAAVACRRYAEVPAGDHVLVLGEVQAVEIGAAGRRPLGFYSSTFSTLTPLAGHHVPAQLWSGGLDVWG